MINPIENLPFEAALVELDDIVGKLESGDLTLEASLTLFERGQALANHCNLLLEKASLRVEQLTSDGEIALLEE